MTTTTHARTKGRRDRSWSAPPLPRLLDGGDGGVLLVAADLGRPWRLALALPGRTAHRAKGRLTRYLLWKLRTGRSAWP